MNDKNPNFIERLRGIPPQEAESVENTRPGNVRRVPLNEYGKPLSPELPPRIDTREVDIVKRGEAIAHVRALEDTVQRLTGEVARVTRELERCQDRCTMVQEERIKWRTEATKYRALVLELASDMNALSLLTQRAQDTHERVRAIIEAEAEEDPNEGKTQGSLGSASLARPSPVEKANEAVVAALQEGASDEPREHSVPYRTPK